MSFHFLNVFCDLFQLFFWGGGGGGGGILKLLTPDTHVCYSGDNGVGAIPRKNSSRLNQCNCFSQYRGSLAE